MLYARRSFCLALTILKAAGINHRFDIDQLLELNKFALGAMYVLLDFLFELYHIGSVQ